MTRTIIKYWSNGGVKHEILFDGYGCKYIEVFYNENGECDRDPLEGPALIYYHYNGLIKKEEYKVNGKLHRDPEQGPALFYYFPDGAIIRQSYSVNDKEHNPYGLAIINNELSYDKWYFNGVEYTNEVNEYLDRNELTRQDMSNNDFDIMWTILL